MVDGMSNIVNTDGLIVSSNSSTTALNDSEVFTGEWVDVSGYDSIVVAVKTDQNGTFSVQYSPDGTNIDSTLTRYYRTTGIEAPHRFTNTRQYARVVFTNDSGSNQTYFRLQTLVGDRADLNAPIDSTLARDFDATCVRPTDFHTEVALGRRQGVTTWNKFGYNRDVDSASGDEVIAAWGGTFQYITSGETIDIVSTSTADDLVGTGVQRIVVYGVDENWDSQTVVYEMDGTTTVTSTEQWIGINRVAVFKAGTGKKNAGTITVTATSSGYTMAQMPAGESVTQQLIFYVPQDSQFLAEWLRFNALKLAGGGNPEITFRFWVYSDVNTAEQLVYEEALDVQTGNFVDVHPPLPFTIGEKSICWCTANTDSNDTSVTGRFSGELFSNPDALS